MYLATKPSNRVTVSATHFHSVIVATLRSLAVAPEHDATTMQGNAMMPLRFAAPDNPTADRGLVAPVRRLTILKGRAVSRPASAGARDFAPQNFIKYLL
jgi:hypothetical protein